MKTQPLTLEWPTERLVKALLMVVDEQAFSTLRKRIMAKKIKRLAKRGQLDFGTLDSEWLYRICCASLMLHDYHWHAWEWRSAWASELATKPWAYPRWDGQKRRILLVAEQGLGDEIVFASCYNELAQDVEEAWIECDPRLLPIFSRSFPENLHFVNRFIGERRVVPRMSDYPAFHEGRPIEAFIMCGNVPKLYRRSPKDFPAEPGFLKASDERSEKTVGAIGCSWKGRQGEITPIKEGVSLQYGETDHRGLLVPGIDLKWDLDGVFALIAGLKKVVTTTNAVAHMAGALGVPTDCIKPPPIFATKDDGFNNRVTPWWPYDHSDWYPSITMYANQSLWKAKNRSGYEH